MTHPILTIDPLPPNHQSRESNEEEDAAHHCLPFVGAMVHLCEGLVELEPVHWRQAVCGRGLMHNRTKDPGVWSWPQRPLAVPSRTITVQVYAHGHVCKGWRSSPILVFLNLSLLCLLK